MSRTSQIEKAIETQRLSLVPLSVDTIDALIAGDTAELLHQTGARFTNPFELPPLFDRDELTRMREQADRDDGSGAQTRMIVSLEHGEPVGMVGLSHAGEPGVLTLGYSVYPQAEGNGYATEAAAALTEWALGNKADVIRASIPPSNKKSICVAGKLGMTKIGSAPDLDAGEVLVYELRSR